MNALAAVAQPTEQDQQQTTDPIAKLKGWINSVNIADEIDIEVRRKIGDRVYREYEIDDNSRADWKQKTQEAMDLALQVAKEKAFPWPKAANIIYPLVTTASMQFAARAYPAIVNGRNVVRGVVVGPDDGTPVIDPRTGQPAIQPGPPDPQTGQPTPMPVWQIPPGGKQIRANQIGEHMSWQLLDEQPEWESETDRLLHILPIVGLAPRKSYFDPAQGRNASVLVLPMKLVINYKAKSYETAPRITEELEFYPNEIEEMQRAGLWIPPTTPYGQAENANGDDDAPHTFLEQHRFWDLDEDGYAEPYIVTIHKDTRHVCRIVARFDEEGIKLNRKGQIAKIEPVHYYTLYGFIPNPESAVYPLGFGQLLRPINEGINTVLNQLLDAGTLQNTGGGFIGKGLSMNAGAIRFQLGEYKVVNVTGGSLRDNIVPMQFAGPSPVLFQLLGMLVESGKEIAAIKDVLTGDQPQANVPATTTLAMIEQGLKVFTAIYKRVHRALKSELAKLYRLNRIYGDEVNSYKVGDTWKVILKQDYVLGSGAEPVSDPTMVSDMQRMGRAQFLLGFANDPMCDGKEIRMRAFKAADIESPEKIVRDPPPNLEIAIKGHELDLKDKEITSSNDLKRAQMVQAYSTAIRNLAEADATVGDQHIQWLDQNLRIWEAQFSAATQPTKNADGSVSAPGGKAPPPPGLPHPATLTAPSNNIQPDISDTDTMTGGIRGDDNGNLRISPQSQYAADHSGAQ